MSDQVANTDPKKTKWTEWKIVTAAKYLAVTLSVLTNVVVVGYYGFYGHRTKVNDTIISQYSTVKEKQDAVYQAILSAVPSKRNSDRIPDPEVVAPALKALDELQAALAMMSTNSDPLKAAADRYKRAIGDLSKAIIAMNYEKEWTFSEAQFAFTQWDYEALSFKAAYDERTTSFWRTIQGVI